MPSYELSLRTFEGFNTQVLGISVDHVPCLKAWAESLGGISYPLLSDFWPHGAVAQAFGVLRSEGYTERALFIVDKQGVIRFVDIHDISQQPDNEQVYRVLRALEPDAVLDAEAAVVSEPVTSQAAIVTARPVAPGSVIMYCRPGCIDCRLARRFLDQNGVQYTEVNVLSTPGAEQKVRAWTGGDLISPVFDVDGQIIIDLDRAALRKALNLA